MNFSENLNLRKPLSLLMATALTATLFTGCSLFKKDPLEPSDTTPPTLGLNLSDTTEPTNTSAETTEPTTAVNENTATVTSQINIRSSPSTEATVVGTLDAGDKVEISRREEVTGINWAYIISPEAGWIVMDYVEMDIPSQMPSGGDTETPGASASTEPSSGSSETLNLKGIVTVNNLNIRSEGSQDGKVQGSYNKGDIVTIQEAKNGWGRTSKGWISLNYVYQDGTTGSNTAKGTITASGGLNIRNGPGTGYASVGSYAEGDSVTILEQFTYDGVTWGCTNKGWISMKYVDTGSSDSSNSDDDSTDGQYGTVVAEGGLRVRTGAGPDFEGGGSLKYGTRVKIYSQKTVGDTNWGEISTGWISLDYVSLDD